MNEYHREFQGPIAPNAATLPIAADRAWYIAKVYAMAFTGVVAYFLSFAIPIVLAMAGFEPAVAFCNFWIGLPWLLSLVFLIGGAWLASLVAETPVLNFFAFYGFAAAFGFLSIGLVVYATGVGGAAILLQAAGLTTFVFGGLSAFVLITRRDFGFLGGFLFCGLLTLIGAALLFYFAGPMLGIEMSAAHLGLSIAGVLLFMGYVLYDTSNLLHRYRTDQVVPAALALMIDFIILFRNILVILAARR